MSQDKEREALLHYKRVYSEISTILACRAEMPPPDADDEITVQRLKALVEEREVYADSCAAKAERIDRLGEMVERLSGENKELRAALATQPPAVQGDPLTEWEARGMLARLKCWHRLTEQEAHELVQFAVQGGIHSRGEGEKA